MMKKFFKKNGLRTVIQTGILLFIAYWWIRVIINPNLFVNFEAYCPFGGVQSIFTYLESGSLACSMTSMQMVMGIALVVGVILFSKLFCSYLCPLGTISEWFSSMGKKLKIQHEITGVADKVLRSFKYLLLGITVYFTLASNELFCKQYDPFYAAASLFGYDVVPWMAILALLLLGVGSMITPMFWCRYICPLGAISNLFKHLYIVIFFLVGFGVMILLKIEVSWIFVLGLIFAAGYFFEVFIPENSKTLQVLKITRDTQTCIDCGLCSKACPQGIDGASVDYVTHSDCNLCGDCLSACPVKGALTVNNRNNFRWIPVIALFVLVLSGLYFGNKVEIPTVNVKWGEKATLENASEFEFSGLKNIKCYGSSMSFVNQMKTVPGILGAATYVNSHSIKLWYDSTAISSEQIKKALFSPVRVSLTDPEDSVKIAIFDASVYAFFDQMDVFYLEKLLRETNKVYAFETRFGEPVMVRIYCKYDCSHQELKDKIEQKILSFEDNGLKYNIDLKFEVPKIERTKEYVTGLGLKQGMFLPFKRTFNGYSSYPKEQISVLEAVITEYPRNKQMMPYLINSVGRSNKFIVGVNAFYDSVPKMRVYFINDSTDFNTVLNSMNETKLSIQYTNGVSEVIDNPYRFE